MRALADNTFLSPWTWPNLHFLDRGIAKEFVDVCVVFGNDVFLFSIKDIAFSSGIAIEKAWARWIRKSLVAAAHQVAGSARLLTRPDLQLFLDQKCSTRLPLSLPSSAALTVRRVAVAFGAREATRKAVGGDGSWVLVPRIVGDGHFSGESIQPFAVGDLDPTKPFVHAFDDTSLFRVLSYFDTVTDLKWYLDDREGFIRSGKLGIAAGEEAMIAWYMRGLQGKARHQFRLPPPGELLHLTDDLWPDFLRSPHLKAKTEANLRSYAWDRLIEKTGHYWRTGELQVGNEGDRESHLTALRIMASEHRTVRRILADSLLTAIKKSGEIGRFTRVIAPSEGNDHAYVIVGLRRPKEQAYEEYLTQRRAVLFMCTRLAQLGMRQAKRFVGIAIDGGDVENRTEDFLYLEAEDLTPEVISELETLQQESGFLTQLKYKAHSENEFPKERVAELVERKNRGTPNAKPGRNDPCPCQSGKKFKHCHGP